ncbi:MAG: lysoplasmalogenase [Clostridiales bacterium]|jgi:uncharacterized membrane protein YhhN|nr:lysoplasmalogenase [Clostridiales bacterium]
MFTVIFLGALGILIMLSRQLLFKKIGNAAGLAFKTFASLCFCFAGVFAALEHGIDMRVALILAAFLMALTGDILLALPPYLKEDYVKFISGIGGAAFVFGHILYIVAFAVSAEFMFYLLPAVLLIPTVFAVLIKTGKLKPEKKAALPIICYGLILGAMATTTLNLVLKTTVSGYTAFAAALLFVLSDTALFFFNFGSDKIKSLHGKLFTYFVMVPYFAAQALFAVTILYL